MSQLPDVEDLLDQLSGCYPREIDLSLDRMTRLLEKLSHPERHLPPVIHVAGTNGKGSTIAFMKAMLQGGGYRVHTYTSPHLIQFNERISLDGQDISDSLLKEVLHEVICVNNHHPLTLFEGITAAAFLAFSRHPGDILLLETGLGGRLDATNVLDSPEMSVLTPISLDHQDYLGETVIKIAAEKAGIIKRAKPVVVGWQRQEVASVIKAKAKEMGSPSIFLQDNPEIISMINHCSLGLQGQYQENNAALAYLALNEISQKFPISHNQMVQGLSKAQWPGRWQQITQGILSKNLPLGGELWVDGAHNEEGVENLIVPLKEWKRQGHPVVVGINTLKNRPLDQFINRLKPFVDQWFFINRTEDQRFHDQGDGNFNFDQEISLEDLVNNLASWSNGARILITGSLYLVGDVLKLNQSHSLADLENRE